MSGATHADGLAACRTHVSDRPKFDKLLGGNVYNASQGFCFASSG